jgi:MFS transporter, AAHS family, 4-hydroxybenzoate transporter
MTSASAIEISDLVDNRPIDRWLIGLTVLCALVLAFDDYDTQAIGYVAPALIQEFNTTKASLGPIFSAGLFGLLLGSLICGRAADRFGRRLVIIVATSWFAICAGATPFAPSRDHLFVLRLLTGLGLGGALPNAVALVGEYTPKRRRATMITITFCGFSIGAAIGGALASWIVPYLGWRAVFYIGGAGPLLLLPVLWLKLPEFLRILVIRKSCETRIAAILSRMGHPTIAAHRLISQDQDLGFAVAHLFRDHRAAPTLPLWMAFFMNLVTLYFLTHYHQRCRRLGKGGRVDYRDVSGWRNLGGRRPWSADRLAISVPRARHQLFRCRATDRRHGRRRQQFHHACDAVLRCRRLCRR